MEIYSDTEKLGEVQLKGGNVLNARNIIIATGASPKGLDEHIPVPKVDGGAVIIMECCNQRPLNELLVIGSGAIGQVCIFTMRLASYGGEARDRILVNEDVEISSRALDAFEGQGSSLSLLLCLRQSVKGQKCGPVQRWYCCCF